MIRPTTAHDHQALIDLATQSGLFEPDQTELLAEMLAQPSETDVWLTDEQDGVPVGVAYLAPEKMTDGTWNLYWIAVHPGVQRQGRGRALLAYVETWLREREQRMLLVETAGIDEFDYVRQFYASQGYRSVACIPEFYEAGVDKIVFCKSLV